MGRFPTFVLTMLALDLFGFSLGTAILPPDVDSQLVVVVPTLFLAPAIAYWLVYMDGYEYFQLRRYTGE